MIHQEQEIYNVFRVLAEKYKLNERETFSFFVFVLWQLLRDLLVLLKWRNPTVENGLETEEFSSDDLTFCCRNCRHVFFPKNITFEDICLALAGI